MWFLLLFDLLFSNHYDSSIGKYTIEIYDGKINDIPELINVINNEANKLITTLGKIKKEDFSIYITNSLEKFNTMAGPVPEWGIAIAKKNPNIIIMQSPSVAKISYSRFIKVLKHEINHIYMFNIPKYETIPSWFKEGMAMYFSKEFSLLHKIKISQHLWKNNIIPLKQIKFINKKNNVTLQYAESAAAIESLIFYYGKDIILKIFNNLHSNQNFKAALENAINEDYTKFEEKFINFLNNNYKWVFLLKAGKYIYVILPFILTLGFYYKNFKNKKILKKWELEELEN